MNLSPTRFPFTGGVVTAFGVVAIIAGGIGALIGLGAAQFGDAFWPGMLMVAVTLSLQGLGFLALRLGARLRAETAAAVLEGDARDPVLYCRAFSSDGVDGNDEQNIASLFRGIGPVIAVGHPGDRLLIPGAARMYLREEEWQQTVSDLMTKARLVLFKVSSTPNLIWEFETAVKRLPGNRIVLIPPKNQQDWDTFREMAKKVELPRETAGAALICWGHDGNVRLLPRLRHSGDWWEEPRVLHRLMFLTTLRLE